jgi:hypothetical protein
MIRALVGWLTGGVLDRLLATVDRRIASETDRERLKADMIIETLRTRADYMRAGGFWLMLIFALPLAFWWASVLIYSVLWCQGCAWPQDWTIAALPGRLDEWSGVIIASIFGVVGLSSLKR